MRRVGSGSGKRLAGWVMLALLSACGGGSGGGAGGEGGDLDGSVSTGAVGGTPLGFGGGGGSASMGTGGTAGSTTPDGSIPNGSGGMNSDAGVGGGVNMDAALPGLSSAVIVSPAVNARVYREIPVKGTALPGAHIELKLLAGNGVITSADVVVDEKGDFAFVLRYAGVADGQKLSVIVIVHDGGETSDPSVVSVVHHAPYRISGRVRQQSGETQGTKVVVRIYDSNAPGRLLDWIDQQTLAATSGVLFPSTAYDFSVPDGTYHVRVFRDTGGPGLRGPDGQPTLSRDPQAAAVTVAINGGNATPAEIVLAPRTSIQSRYEGLDAHLVNAGPVGHPPSVRQNGNWSTGPGQCGGVFLKLVADQKGVQGDLSPLRVRPPRGADVQLRDDGGCGQTVLDNSASSYDEREGDKTLTRGFAFPTAQDAGNYTFFYQQSVDDFVHIEVDTVASVAPLSSLREITAPASGTIVGDPTPSLDWDTVPGAASYLVSLRQVGGGYNNDTDGGRVRNGGNTVYTVGQPVMDDTCYEYYVLAFDAVPGGGDVDSVSIGNVGYFCVDFFNDSTITLTGAIRNHSGKPGPTTLRVRSGSNRIVTARLPSGAENYAISVPRGEAGKGEVSLLLDVDRSGEEQSAGNRGYRVQRDELDLLANASVDLSIGPRVEVIAPVWLSTQSVKPKFSWRDYKLTTTPSLLPSKDFVYVVFASTRDGPPDFVQAVPSTTLDFDLADPPAANKSFDVMAYYNCLQDGGTYTVMQDGQPACAGATLEPGRSELPPGIIANWGILVFECDFADYLLPADSSNAFVACLGKAIGDSASFGSGGETIFRVP
jgi:hypothetical protein